MIQTSYQSENQQREKSVASGILPLFTKNEEQQDFNATGSIPLSENHWLMTSKKKSSFFPNDGTSIDTSATMQKPKILNSRIIVFKNCNEEKLQRILVQFTNKNDISAYKHFIWKKSYIFVVGWYDSRKIPLQVQQLKMIYETSTNKLLEYSYIDNAALMNAIILQSEFQFLEDSYTETYIVSLKCDRYLDNTLRQELYLYLTSGFSPSNMPRSTQLFNEAKYFHQLKHKRLTSLPLGFTKVPEENQINIENIRNRVDNRVTIMIKNIPNKITHDELKNFIDITNENTYDFLYLRIDFENHCNVGYAFVSFTDPQHIIKFHTERKGKKWNKFKSDKICELAYARVQGKQELIKKFKNSKIMEENPEYRPRIYHTEGPLLGKEAQFPIPDQKW
ncbi:hypothetical protein CANARDRAFT_7723 [[Candida] arabinofermentans NRRL YB-2248]|uniref:RRM domain-containing protein n=1 Tax=[Candida] arabinofermentans NRRL YB-2248 TaxID=983967 RepID=A0A1E4T1I5_9ASCO|nr:hypothetical protein CANARDRAFT_7723 [[Candida] arabinofermentans NRRL YB-2248]